MRLKPWVLGIVIITFISLSACQGGTLTRSLSVEDALGRTVSFPTPPQKIIIAGRANFMLNDAVYLFPDAPERVLALTRSTQAANAFVNLLDPEAEAKTRFMSDAAAEEIAAAQPDLVLLKSYMKDPLGDTLEQLGIPVVYLEFETPEQYERDLATLGKLFGDANRAEKLWGYYQEILERAADATEGLTDAQRPRVLLLQYTEKGGEVAFKVPPASWIQTQMVTLAGGIPVWTEAAQGGGWATVNLEQIAAWDADQIYIINYFGSAVEVVKQLQTDTQWSVLRAVRDGYLIPFASDLHSWDQPDTRWGLGLLWLGQQIQPERFAGIDLEDEVYGFFGDFYGLDRATIDSEIMALLNASQLQP